MVKTNSRQKKAAPLVQSYTDFMSGAAEAPRGCEEISSS